MTKAIVLLSGGLDSTVLTYELVKQGYLVDAVSFLYGQKHKREIDCACTTCGRLGLTHHIFDVSGAFAQFAGHSAITNNVTEIPKEHYEHENQKITVVPNRNMIFLSFAIAMAEALKIPEVYFAAHANDKAIYPDCRGPFVYYISEAARVGTYQGVRVLAPFVHMTKKAIAERGIDLKVDFENTWSCYEGGVDPCWKCGTCQERLEAFSGRKI